jgi:hypothetical protein
MQRIIICMDGTRQTLNQARHTNIAIIARSAAHKETLPDGTHIHQHVIYSQGVGSTVGALEEAGLFGNLIYRTTRLFGGAFGEGLEDIIVETYLSLAFVYEDGDEIYIFGFISVAGIVSRRHAERAREGFRLYYRAPGEDAPQAEKDSHADHARVFRIRYGKGTRDETGARRAIDRAPHDKLPDRVCPSGFASRSGPADRLCAGVRGRWIECGGTQRSPARTGALIASASSNAKPCPHRRTRVRIGCQLFGLKLDGRITQPRTRPILHTCGAICRNESRERRNLGNGPPHCVDFVGAPLMEGF